ncbi:hypothetical protein [Bacillus sp. 37MA]|nr:hypothetical protein [Bacillus sp. 37MA]
MGGELYKSTEKHRFCAVLFSMPAYFVLGVRGKKSIKFTGSTFIRFL